MRKTTAENGRKVQIHAAEWHFRDLIVWQKSMKLAETVYRASSGLPREEMFGLTSQMRRAAVSVPSNIAEGCGRVTSKGIRVFFGHARGSAYELETQIQIAESLGLFQRKASQPLIEACWEIVRMLNALMARLEREDA